MTYQQTNSLHRLYTDVEKKDKKNINSIAAKKAIYEEFLRGQSELLQNRIDGMMPCFYEQVELVRAGSEATLYYIENSKKYDKSIILESRNNTLPDAKSVQMMLPICDYILLNAMLLVYYNVPIMPNWSNIEVDICPF